MNPDYIGSKLNDALNDESYGTVIASAVIDRKLYPTDEDRSKAVNELLEGLNLLEYVFFPIVGVIQAEGYGGEIRKMLESPLVANATLIG